MVASPVNIVLFEDDGKDARLLVDSFRSHASTGKSFCIVWFEEDFRRPKGDDRRMPYPISVSSNYRPTVFHVNSSGIAEARGETEYWQSDFHGAILDILDKSNSRDVGHRYAEWLSLAEFTGPVVLTSKETQEPPPLSGLTKLSIIPKTYHSTGTFHQEAVEFVATSAYNEPSQFQVNFNGRKPMNFLKDFYRVRPGHKPDGWSCAYFGNDPSVARELQEFLCVSSFDDLIHPIATLKDALIEADRPSHSKPKVVIVDCCERGNCLDDELAIKVREAFQAVSYRPIGLILADREKVENRHRLGMLNAGRAKRSLLTRHPSVWAAHAVKGLANAYRDFLKTKQRHRVARDMDWPIAVAHAGQQVIGSLLFPFMMARAINRICGSSGYQHFAAWTDSTLGEILNSSFASMPRAILTELTRWKLASDGQLDLFCHHSRLSN
jgi:hypothetical protein